jgi:hypothetical protein
MKHLAATLGLAITFGFAQAQEGVLRVARVDSTTFDASADVWDQAPILEVQTRGALEGAADGPVVMLQATHDNEFLAIRAQWADDTESIFKNAWTYDGTAFSKSGDEDRLLFAWPIQENADFSSRGCTAACHATADDPAKWWMGSDQDGVTYDAWQFKASRTYAAGYVDDKWWGTLGDPDDVESSRHGDARDGGSYSTNANDDATGPAFMSSQGPDARFILAGDAIELDTSALSAGDRVPGYVLERPVGSRGDIEVSGGWENGTWVIVMRRLLATGHDDDVEFGVGGRVPFGLAVIDDGGGLRHTIAPEPLVLDW